MKKTKRQKKFSVNDFERIQKLTKQDRLVAVIAEYEMYLEKYPNDICSWALYADSLIKLGRFEEAKIILDNIVVDNKTSVETIQTLTLIKIKFLSCLQQYQECYELVRENIDIFENKDWGITELLIFLKKKLNLLLDIDYSGYSYKIDQIVSYNEKSAIECIKTCHMNSEYNPPFCFDNDFPVEDVFYKIKSMLPSENKIYRNVINNCYIFKYDNNGTVHGKKVNYIEVVTLQGTNEIVTMYPYENRGKLSYIDITPEITLDECKVKRISQIDKFNQRYGKKVDKVTSFEV